MSTPSRDVAITPANSSSQPTTSPTATVSGAAAATTDDAPTSTRTVDDVSLIQPNESQTGEIETARTVRSGSKLNGQVVVLVLIALGIGTVHQML